MKTILIGNGFNIKLGGPAYSNKSIINRLLNNTKTKDYSSMLFNGTFSNAENTELLPGLCNELKSILAGNYDEVCTSAEEQELISLLKRKYTPTDEVDQVGMEDYFIILRLVHLRFNDPEEMIRSTHIGLCWEFLDAIYNEGAIQQISETIDEQYKIHLREKLAEYDDIFTVNYDKNIEVIASRKVKYLHGNFETLSDQYDDTTLLGASYKKGGKASPVSLDNAHMYSNCLMGFSGTYKESIIQIMDNGQLGADILLTRYRCGMISDEDLLELKNSKDEDERLVYGMITAFAKNPSLKMHTYPMQEFKRICGEIHLLGISPSNDEHIWNSIFQNPRITKIVYYYNTESSRKKIENLIKDERLVLISANSFWP